MEIWEERWKEDRGPNLFGKMLFHAQKKAIEKILRLIDVQKSAKILDVGCGTGRTLRWLREFGFKNSVGIDISEHALKICGQNGFAIGKDVFLMSGDKIKFKNKEFDIVFAEGVLEHFKNFAPLVKEMCRVSKKYVIITQPNHFSLFGRFLERFTEKDVYEYSYKIEDFINCFKKFDFGLVKKIDYNLNEQWLLLFESRR